MFLGQCFSHNFAYDCPTKCVAMGTSISLIITEHVGVTYYSHVISQCVIIVKLNECAYKSVQVFFMVMRCDCGVMSMSGDHEECHHG